MRIDVAGVNLNYQLYGAKGDKPPVLLLHGWGCSSKHFEQIAQALAKDRLAVALDFPAHGDSGRPPQPWGVPEFSKATLQFMQALDLAPCDIVAHSFGGRVALYLAANQPDAVNRLALTGCAGLKSQQTPEQKKKSEAYQRKKRTLQKIAALPLIGGAADKALEALRKKYGSADYNALDAEMRKTFVQVISQDLRPLLPKIQASTLLVWGEKDTETPLWMGQTMEKEIKDAGLVVFEGEDHFAYLRQWPRFAAILQSFLD